MGPIISRTELGPIRTRHPGERIVYCSGAFDLTHIGHILFFEECKRQGGILVVGVACDELVRRNKGPWRPILNEQIRLHTVASLKPVDYCFIDPPVPPDVYPLTLVEQALEALRPECYAINTDAFNIPFRLEIVHRLGVEIKIVDRQRAYPPEFVEISTSWIIHKVQQLEA